MKVDGLVICWYNNNNNNSTNNLSSTNDDNSEFHKFVPTRHNAVRLEDWIASDDQNGICHTERQQKYVGWKCASNCYLRWLNFPRGFCAPPHDWMPGRALYPRAWDSAQRYNVIVHMERLATDLSYVHGLERLFGVRGLQGYHQAMWCSKESKRANEQVPLELSNATRHGLDRRNWPDYTLYDYLVTHPRGIVFPNVVWSDLV